MIAVRGSCRVWLAAAAALATAVAATFAGAQQADDATARRLSDMSLSLTHAQPYQFVLAYHGPIMPFRGRLCYHFAGYNETCMNPKLEWLTPATRIELYAPGGVPRDLLQGYLMLVRYPALSDRTFRYALSIDP